MARRLCQTLLAIALVYLAVLGIFALVAYAGPRPNVVTIARDFHRYVVGRGGPAAPPAEAGEIPPEVPVPAPPPPPPPDVPSAPPADTAPLDARGKTLAKVRNELLPEAERLMGRIHPGSKDLMEEKAAARTVLVEARDLLGALIDLDSKDTEAHKLYKRVMEHLIAVDKR